MNNVAKINDVLYVGNREACNLNKNKYDAIIHIWRNDFIDYSCDTVYEYLENDYFIRNNIEIQLDYMDGEPLSTAQLNKLYDFYNDCRDNEVDKLLVHCTAGLTRAPTIGLFMLSLIEDKHPLSCINRIYASLWMQRKLIPNICMSPLRSMVEWYEDNLSIWNEVK